jgi:glycosyltransferase involved in cell wall biosynthesis
MGGTSVSHLVRGLLDAGETVSVYTLDPAVDKPVVMDGAGLRVYVGPCRRRHRMRDFMRAERRWVRRFVVSDGPDLVHAHWTYEYALGALAAGPPTLITVRDWAPAILGHWRDLYRVGRLLMNGVALWRGTDFIANSPYIQSRLEGIVRRPVPVIPNAIDDGLFRAPDRRCPPSPPVLVSVNNGFDRRKNVGALLRAFARLRTRRPEARLRLVGAGYGAGGAACRWAGRHGLADGVAFVGRLDYAATMQEIRAAGLLVHPALEESFGSTLLEAMASGTPVVAGRDSGAVPWVTAQGRAARLIDVTRPACIAAAVDGLLADTDRWAALARAGHARACARFRLSVVVDRHLQAYRALLDRRAAPPASSATAPTAFGQ